MSWFLRVLLCCVICLFGGCASLTGLLHFSSDGQAFLGEHWHRDQPTGPVTQSFRVHASLDERGISVACNEISSQPVQRTEEGRIGPAGRVAYGFFGLSESAVSAFLIGTDLQDGRIDDPAALVIGSLVGIDALITWVLTFAYDPHQFEVSQRSNVQSRGACPEGLTIFANEIPLGVSVDGSIDRDRMREALLPMVQAGTRVELRVQDTRQHYFLGLSLRCALKENLDLQGDGLESLCPQALEVPSTPVLVQPLQPSAVVPIPVDPSVVFEPGGRIEIDVGWDPEYVE